MTQTSIYQDIAERTGGSIYVGVVGPVRTGKSTFIKNIRRCLPFQLPRSPREPTFSSRARCG